MIIWSGYGFVVVIVVLLCGVGVELVTETLADDDTFYQQSSWPLPLALAISGFLTFLFNRVALDDDRGEHSLFFVPVFIWGPLLGLIAVIVFIYRLAA